MSGWSSRLSKYAKQPGNEEGVAAAGGGSSSASARRRPSDCPSAGDRPAVKRRRRRKTPEEEEPEEEEPEDEEPEEEEEEEPEDLTCMHMMRYPAWLDKFSYFLPYFIGSCEYAADIFPLLFGDLVFLASLQTY